MLDQDGATPCRRARKHIRVGVSDDPRRLEVEVEVARRLEQHAGRGLAAVTRTCEPGDGPLWVVGTHLPGVELDPLGAQ